MTTADRYQDDRAWGRLRIPEDRLGVLGDVAGLDVLELGCGAARWSIALHERGACMVGLDVSERRLADARRLMAAAGARFPLVQASAEAIPLPSSIFDVVFCDRGAMSAADPHRTVPEVARVLRPGGLFAFSTATPIAGLPHGAWLRLFRGHGFTVEQLLELRPDPGAPELAHRRPLEQVWKLRRGA